MKKPIVLKFIVVLACVFIGQAVLASPQLAMDNIPAQNLNEMPMILTAEAVVSGNMSLTMVKVDMAHATENVQVGTSTDNENVLGILDDMTGHSHTDLRRNKVRLTAVSVLLNKASAVRGEKDIGEENDHGAKRALNTIKADSVTKNSHAKNRCSATFINSA